MAWSVDCLGRSLQGLCGLLSELHSLGIDPASARHGHHDPGGQGHVSEDGRVRWVRTLDDPRASLSYDAEEVYASAHRLPAHRRGGDHDRGENGYSGADQKVHTATCFSRKAARRLSATSHRRHARTGRRMLRRHRRSALLAESDGRADGAIRGIPDRQLNASNSITVCAAESNRMKGCAPQRSKRNSRR